MPQLTIKPAFEFGQIVTLKTDIDHFRRMVVGYHVSPIGINYELKYGDEETTFHSYIEIEEDKPKK